MNSLVSLVSVILIGIILSSFATYEMSTLHLSIQLSGVKNDNGQVILDLFSNNNGFPTKPEYAIRRVKAKIINGRASFSLSNLKKGEYAFAIIHDENLNGKLDTNLLGMPKEGACASNNAKGLFGPPSFEDSKFNLTTNGKNMHVEMIYFFKN